MFSKDFKNSKTPSNKEIASRLQEIILFVDQNSSGEINYGRSQLKGEFPKLLQECIGSYANPGFGLMTHLPTKIDDTTDQIVDLLDDLLFPKRGLFEYAWKMNKDPHSQFMFPINGLPKHTQTLLERKMYDNIPDLYNNLTFPIQEQIKYIEIDKSLVLSSFEYFLFSFFSKICRIDKKDEGCQLVLSTSKNLFNQFL